MKKYVFTLILCKREYSKNSISRPEGKTNKGNLTLKSGEPLISTLSANRTLLGFDLSFAFFAADRRADFLLEL